MEICMLDKRKDGIHVLCLNWGGSGAEKTKIPGIWEADFDDLLDTVYYTNNKKLVTCKACLEKIKKGRK
jgi:hypothetical protein